MKPELVSWKQTTQKTNSSSGTMYVAWSVGEMRFSVQSVSDDVTIRKYSCIVANLKQLTLKINIL